MFEIILVVLLPIAALILTFLTSKGSLYDNRKKWYRRITQRGWFAIGINIFIIVVTGLLYYLSEEKSDEKDRVLNQNQTNMRDSIRIGIDSGNARLFRGLSEALAKQNLKLDTVNKELTKIKDDSSKRGVTVISGAEPVLGIIVQTNNPNRMTSTKLEDGKYKISVPYESADAASTDYDIVAHLGVAKRFSLDTNDYAYSYSTHPLRGSYMLSQDRATVDSVVLNTKGEFNLLWIWVKGSYKNANKTMSHDVDMVYYLDVTSNKSGIVSGLAVKRIIQTLSKNANKKWVE
jgi:hypothetical protein